MRKLKSIDLLALLQFPLVYKQAIIAAGDSFLCFATIWITLSLLNGEPLELNAQVTFFGLGLVAVMLAVFTSLNVYRTVFRYAGYSSFILVCRATTIYCCTGCLLVVLVEPEGFRFSALLFQASLFFIVLMVFRQSITATISHIHRLYSGSSQKESALIYGAGSAGRSLSNMLFSEKRLTHSVVGFVDDDKNLQGRFIDGILVYPPSEIPSLIAAEKICHLFFAIPSVSKIVRSQILRRVSEYPVRISCLPSLDQFVNGQAVLEQVVELRIEDLLGREIVSLEQSSVSKMRGKTVLITGAGGSIGGELARQIISVEPSRLILLDSSEFSLYSIHEELEALICSLGLQDLDLVPRLGSIQDETFMCSILETYRPEFIYHAAAYKHVHLVESNVLEGIKNNVFGTLNVVSAARRAGVKNLVLISTDKAVFPVSVMGATKRLAELILQGVQGESCGDLNLSIVRFGNVIGSSGSVIPKFRKQIARRQSVTVTSQEMTRFFMTIPEAAQLVIRASSLDGSTAETVFVLDMGGPVKIIDLARKMIQLSGLKEKSVFDPEGDIEIKVVGLRPGEKLHEQLVSDPKTLAVVQPGIMKASEAFIPWERLEPQIMVLSKLVAEGQEDEAVKLLKHLVDGVVSGSRLQGRVQHAQLS